MSDPMHLLLPILLPILVAIGILPFLRKSPKAMAWTGLAVALVAFFFGFQALAGPTQSLVMPWVGPFSLDFKATQWKAILLAFVFLFQLLNALYLLRFLQEIKRPFLFMVFTLVAFASACLVILTNNVLILLIGWEMFLAALYALILSGGEGTEAVAYKALLIGGASDFLMILGLMLFFHLGGSWDLSAVKPMATSQSWVHFLSFVLIFLGAGAKAGMYPFQTWIPQAAEVMPAPAFAALPASLEKMLGVYFLFLLVNDFFVLCPMAKAVMFLLAAITIYAAVIPAFVETNLKKILALTAISPVGFMIAGLASHAAVGMAGALFYMLTHATYKSAMFYAAGNLELSTGSCTLEALENRKSKSFVTVLGFFMAFAAAISLPPTGGFLAKEFILEGLVEHHHYLMFFLVWLGAILNMAVFMKVGHVLIRGWRDKENQDSEGTLILPVVVLGTIAVLTGYMFFKSGNVVGHLVGAHEGWMEAILHIGPLTVASFGIYVLGAAIFYGLRDPLAPAHTTYQMLRTSPVLGKAYDQAEKGHLDLYELGLKAVNFLAKVVFLYVERLIDVVFTWLVQAGRSITKPALSSIHNGVYSNYLAWLLGGFVLVLSLVLLR